MNLICPQNKPSNRFPRYHRWDGDRHGRDIDRSSGGITSVELHLETTPIKT